MLQSRKKQIRSSFLIVAIVLVSMALGIALNGRVVSMPIQSVIADDPDDEVSKPPQTEVNTPPPLQPAQTNLSQLDNEVESLREQGSRTLNKADNLYARVKSTSVSRNQPSTSQQLNQSLAEIKSRLKQGSGQPVN